MNQSVKTTDVRRINQNTKLNVITNVITKRKTNNPTNCISISWVVFGVELGGVEPPSGYATASAFYMFRVRLIFENRPALP